MTNESSTILGIDPGTKEMGIVVLRGSELLEYGVHTLRNGHQPYDLIGEARRIVLGLIQKWRPDIVALEAPLLLPTKRAALLSVIAQELRAQARSRKLRVDELSPAQIRMAVARNPRATKVEVAEVLVREGFDSLRPLVPRMPKRRAFWLSHKDRYWLHMFDALALAVATTIRLGQTPGGQLAPNRIRRVDVTRPAR
jgi:Holliday junction resolvasome RuvABC endonuclease subunit